MRIRSEIAAPLRERGAVPLALPAASAPGRRSIDAVDDAERRSRLIGIGLFIGALVCFSGTDISAKWLSRTLPTPDIVWARYFFSAVFVLFAVRPWTNVRDLATKRPGLQALRSLLLLGSTAFAFLSLRHLQLAESTSIGFSQPLVIALFAGPVLGEWIGPRRFAAICVGFVGILVVTQPGSGAADPAMLYALAGVVCNSFYYLATRRLAASDRVRITLACTSLAGVILLTPALPWLWVAPQGLGSWVLMIFMGFCGAASQWLVILAHHRAPAAILAPFVYVQILWTACLGYLIFGDVPGAATLVGAGIVVASGLYLWYRERAVTLAAAPAH